MRTYPFVAASVLLLSACGLSDSDSDSAEPVPEESTASVGVVGQALTSGQGSPVQEIAPAHGSTHGTFNWRSDLLGAVTSRAAIGADGVAYVGTSLGVLYAIDPETGQTLWDVFVRGVITSSPVIGFDRTLYVTTDASGLHAVDPVTHLVKWTFAAGVVTASPTLGPDGTIYVGNQAGTFFAVNPNGTQKWKVVTGGAIDSSAAVGADGTIFFGSNDNNVWALTPQGGQKWKRPLPNDVRSSPALSAGTVYVGSDANKLHALSAATGAILWERAVVFAGVRSSPVVGPNGNVFAAAANSRVHAFSPAGAPLWTYPTGGAANSSPVVDVDGRVYVGADDKKLHAINGTNGTPIFTYLAAGGVRSPMLDTDGRVLFGANDTALYSVGKGSRAHRFDINTSLTPADPTDIDGKTGEIVKVSAVVDSEGERSEFVAKELLLATTDPAKLQAFTARYGGTLVETIDFGADPNDDLRYQYAIRLDLNRAPDPATIAANVLIIDPESAQDPENFQVSDADGMKTLSMWADARANGFDVELNFIADSTTITSGVTTDSNVAPALDWTSDPATTWSANAFDWVHFRRDTKQTIGVTDAWQLLNTWGKLTRSVAVGVTDDGFVSLTKVSAWDGPSTMIGLEKPFIDVVPLPPGAEPLLRYHGHACLLAGFAPVDNGIGAAGPGGPVVSAAYIAGNLGKKGYRKWNGYMRMLMDAGVAVVSVSFKWDVPEILEGQMVRRVVERAGRKEMLIVAGAGNENQDIDHKSGLLNRDKHWTLPCEVRGVLCVGGLAHNSLSKQTTNAKSGSNWGAEDVDIWAPWFVPVGEVPGLGATTVFTGTSAATPFVAGIAALVKAANPNLKDEDVRSILVNTSKPSTDPFVDKGIVQAFAAVQAAVGSVAGIKILEPENNAVLGYGTAPATRVTWADPSAPTQPPTVDWLVNGTHVSSGLGAIIPNAVLRIGDNTIEARGQFSQNRTASDAITVKRQLPSSLRILLPVSGSIVRAEEPTFRILSEPLGLTEWSIDNWGVFARDGDRTLPFPLPLPGSHDITARLTDGATTLQDHAQVFFLSGAPKTTIDIVQPNDSTIQSPGVVVFSSSSTDFVGGGQQSPTTGNISWVITNAATGVQHSTHSGMNGIVQLPSGMFVFTAMVSKMVDLDGNGTPDTSLTIASDVQKLRVLTGVE